MPYVSYSLVLATLLRGNGTGDFNKFGTSSVAILQ